jgi:hypothetical protein
MDYQRGWRWVPVVVVALPGTAVCVAAWFVPALVAWVSYPEFRVWASSLLGPVGLILVMAAGVALSGATQLVAWRSHRLVTRPFWWLASKGLRLYWWILFNLIMRRQLEEATMELVQARGELDLSSGQMPQWLKELRAEVLAGEAEGADDEMPVWIEELRRATEAIEEHEG